MFFRSVLDDVSYIPDSSTPLSSNYPASPITSASSSFSMSSCVSSSSYLARKASLDALADRLRLKSAEEQEEKHRAELKKPKSKAKRMQKEKNENKAPSIDSPSAPLRRSSRRHMLHRTVSQEAFLQLEAASTKKAEEQKEKMEVEEQKDAQNLLVCSVCCGQEHFGLPADHDDNFWIQCSICHKHCHAVKCAKMTVEQWNQFDKAEEEEGEDFVCPSCQMYTD